MSRTDKSDYAESFRGTISVAEWGKDNEIVRLRLDTEEGDSYLLTAKPGVLDSADFVDDFVELTGHRTEGDEGPTIEVLSITDFMQSFWDHSFDSILEMDVPDTGDGDDRD